MYIIYIPTNKNKEVIMEAQLIETEREIIEFLQDNKIAFENVNARPGVIEIKMASKYINSKDIRILIDADWDFDIAEKDNNLIIFVECYE